MKDLNAEIIAMQRYGMKIVTVTQNRKDLEEAEPQQNAVTDKPDDNAGNPPESRACFAMSNVEQLRDAYSSTDLKLILSNASTRIVFAPEDEKGGGNA